jgi:hypothetical protein
MSRSLTRRFAFGVAVGLATVAIAVGSTTSANMAVEGKPCSNRTLTGDYGFSLTGHAGPAEILDVGVGSFDGQGGFELRDTLKIVGGPSLPRTISGTYDIEEDCRGTATFHAPPPFDVDIALQLVLVNHGREAYFIQVAPDGFFQGTAKLQ